MTLPDYTKFLRQNVRAFGYVFHDTNGQNPGQTLKIPCVFSNEIKTDTHGEGLSWERQFEEILLEHGWEKVPTWECLFVHRELELFLSVYVDDIEMAAKNENMAPMWKHLMKKC